MCSPQDSEMMIPGFIDLHLHAPQVLHLHCYDRLPSTSPSCKSILGLSKKQSLPGRRTDAACNMCANVRSNLLNLACIQYSYMGTATDRPLMEWLDHYTFPRYDLILSISHACSKLRFCRPCLASGPMSCPLQMYSLLTLRAWMQALAKRDRIWIPLCLLVHQIL